MTTLTSTLYLSTDSTTNPPLYSASKANVSWVVDWDLIFHGKTGLCKVHTNLLSKSATATLITTSWNSLIGTVRASLGSIYSSNSSSLVLANLTPNSVAGSTTVYYYTGVSESNQAPLINIPNGKSQLTIQLLDSTETALVAGVPDYEILLFFEWVSNEVIDKNVPLN
jgi:hypothetical protein